MSCTNSDGVNVCDCQTGNRINRPCEFYHRRLEPFAFAIENDPCNPQHESPLFTTVPMEIRNMIYEYALTDCTSHPPNRDNVFRRYPPRGSKLPLSDIGTALLQTCRAVYLETYKMPILLNPYIVYNFQFRQTQRPKLMKLAPWQYALIQSLDISLQQIALEQGELAGYIERWSPVKRSQGVDGAFYVMPRFYRSFCLVHSATAKDGDTILLPNNPRASYDKNLSTFSPKSEARAMLARPLTRLTLRLSRTDWWTWASPPEQANTQHLHLDPTLKHPSKNQMMQLADQRRAGTHPQIGESWGKCVASIPSLKTLELVLETFAPKRLQLETVVQCAKTWKFPLLSSGAELVWDGRVEQANWTKDPELDPHWSGQIGHFEVRIVRYRRQKAVNPSS
ncbi:hypothetical protein P280DRAFT_518787 [Massarina eburnea CBS 473.64]|uniref:Uncharacterized protein n=1 Tax=Massarina eburnea CBS 473.64 TaxID=1395130 RepID=A0A6A6RXV7_9PLEO|nr:hypothetical protein P280DRAFT_518787 [Massarina eburnea CBS 473.64]